MRSRIALAALPWAAIFILPSREAAATDCSGVLSPCINDDTLWPNPGPARFVAVGSTETVAREQLGFGLVTSYLSRPVVIHVKSPGGGGTDEYVVNDQVNGTFLWSYGVTDRLELDFALPLTFGQSGTGLAPVTGGNGLNDTAARDLRFGLAYRLLPVAESGQPWTEGWAFVGRFEVSAPSGDHSQFAGDRSAVFVPTVDVGYRYRRVFGTAEVGARVRETSELLGARVGTQVVTALGVGLDILSRELLTATLEGWALPTLTQQDSLTRTLVATPDGKYIVPAEWQLSLRTAPLGRGDLAIQLGGGGAIPIDEAAVTRPRFRFALGIRWAPVARPVPSSPHLAEEAPVALRLAASPDTCSEDPDLVDGFKEADGCPDEDQDKDGIDDRFDRCPLAPEDFAGLADGCPEPQKENPR